jgi:hypothetical protein
MNIYHCMIDLTDDAKPLSFAHALSQWMDYLQGAGLIENWQLSRRKLNLASGSHRDFLLIIEVTRLDQLDSLFRHVSSASDEVERLYDPLHRMIKTADFGLYRPYPDPERVERVAIL